jgi:uncharacterized lipoprotein YbaY
MKMLKAVFFCVAVESGISACFAQANWLDMMRGAQPRVSAGNTPSYPNSNPYNPNPNFDPNATSFPSTTNVGAGPMLASNRKDWKLGVYVQNADVGAVVSQVAPGSAGQQAGLEPNDIIVAVGGSRIGLVDGRSIELADEIRRNTDPQGRVSLLVFDSRMRTLQSIPVSMNATSSSITGNVSIRDRMQIPFGSVLTVQIQNVSKPYYEILGGKSMTRAEGYGPFSFELNCDPRYIDPRDQYQLNASISSGNQEIYRLAQPIGINPAAMTQPLILQLERLQGGFDSNPSNSFPGGNVVNAGYPSMDSNQLNQLFLQLLGRSPSNRELLAWQSYLQQGNSINDLKAKLLSSAQYRDRFGNDANYVQQLVTTLTGRAPSQQELAYWMSRLQATGSAETVVGEILARGR